MLINYCFHVDVYKFTPIDNYIERWVHNASNKYLSQLIVQEREVTHLQYIDWPDYGIPENPQPFLGQLLCFEAWFEI